MWLFQLNRRLDEKEMQTYSFKRKKEKETPFMGVEPLPLCWRTRIGTKLFNVTKVMFKLFAVVY